MYYTWFLMNIDPPPCFTLQVLWLLLHFSTSIDFFFQTKNSLGQGLELTHFVVPIYYSTSIYNY